MQRSGEIFYESETYRSSFNDQEYKLYHCKVCDLQWLELLKTVPEFYEQEGEEGYAIFHLGIREELGENHKMFFKHVPVKSGRLLDVGCGDGVFLMYAQKAGYEVWGIDFDSRSIKVCQEKRGLKNTFIVTPWEFAEYCEKNNLKFDVIAFFEVLEHQDDPVGFLESVKRRLKPGGWIAGSVPNRESWMFRLGRQRSLVGFPPHHFLRFNTYSIGKLLGKTGFYSKTIKNISISIKHATSVTCTCLFGDSINKFMRKSILQHEYATEHTSVYKQSSLVKKSIFKFLKLVRSTIFLIPAVIVKACNQSENIFFCGRLTY